MKEEEEGENGAPGLVVYSVQLHLGVERDKPGVVYKILRMTQYRQWDSIEHEWKENRLSARIHSIASWCL